MQGGYKGKVHAGSSLTTKSYGSKRFFDSDGQDKAAVPDNAVGHAATSICSLQEGDTDCGLVQEWQCVVKYGAQDNNTGRAKAAGRPHARRNLRVLPLQGRENAMQGQRKGSTAEHKIPEHREQQFQSNSSAESYAFSQVGDN